MSKKETDGKVKKEKRTIYDVIEDMKKKSDFPDDIPSPFLMEFLPGLTEEELKIA